VNNQMDHPYPAKVTSVRKQANKRST
jgi:hypothetical protein